MTGDEILARYRHLRGIAERHVRAATRFMTGAAMAEQVKRLGLATGGAHGRAHGRPYGRQVAAVGAAELALAGDLAVHAAKDGRSSALERYARAAPPAPGTDEALVLHALRRARFSVWRLERRHEVAGLVLADVLRDGGAWLVDEGLGAAPDGSLFAGRLYVPESFALCAAGVPVTPDVVEEAVLAAPRVAGGAPDEVAQNPRFAAALYRAAIASGAVGGVNHRLSDR